MLTYLFCYTVSAMKFVKFRNLLNSNGLDPDAAYNSAAEAEKPHQRRPSTYQDELVCILFIIYAYIFFKFCNP